MKTSCIVALLGLTLMRLPAQVSTTVIGSASAGALSANSYSVVDRDGNSSVMERTEFTNTVSGMKVVKKHRYVQLEAGMNHLVNGQWVPSSEEINILPDGTAVATNGQHQVYFPGDINQGAIVVVTPQQEILQSRPFVLIYTDGVGVETIGELKDSAGQLVESNQVIYPDAFDGIKADIRYTYTKAGFEQDIILRQQPPAPELLGLDPAKTRIEVMTEFFDAPQPELNNGVADAGSKMQDTRISLGGMSMTLGKAFSTSDTQQKITDGATVFKSWLVAQGRTFLVEKLPYKNIAQQLQTLPLHASITKPSGNLKMAMLKPSPALNLPAQHPVKASTRPVMLAKADSQTPGVVLDYMLLSGVYSNYVFQADTTYLMDQYFFQITGLATFEGGTVIKFVTNSAGFQLYYGGVSCQSSPYRPIILTAKDDDTVGEIIAGSTGNPSGYYGSGMTLFNNSNVTLHDIRMSYLSSGIGAYATLELDNIQAVNCWTPIVHLWAGITINNGLFYNIGNIAVQAAGGASSVTAAQLTIDNCNTFADTNTLSLTIANSLVTATTNLLAGAGTLATNKVTILASNSGIYQTVGAGSHYLANGSPYRALGTNAIDATLLAGLPSRTTYPPVIYSNMTISVSTNFPLQAKRDTNSSPDLGYHYDPLDYLTDNLTITNATLTMSNGVAIACYNEPGIMLRDNAVLTSIGTPLLPNWFVRYQSVQDKSIFLGGTNAGLGQNIAVASLISNRPNAIVKFTRFAVPANGGFMLNHSGNNSFNTLAVQHSEFWGGTNNLSGPTNAATVSLFNNLFYRSGIAASNSASTASLAFTNNLIYGTVLSLVKPASGSWYFFNNDVDTCSVDANTSITNGYNAFISSSFSLSGTGTITTTNAVGYQTGALGVFYQPTNSVLINVGNVTANQMGLNYFTTLTNQVAESNSVVDIGYHYVALNASGKPLDLNTNGIPDYLEGAGNQPVAITTQPTNQTVLQGSNAAFSVIVTGTTPLSYQWWFKATNKLAWATSATLTVTNAQSTNAGNYTVVITNVVNAVTSSIASLTVWIPPTVTITNPLNNATFSAPTNLTINATNWDVSGVITQAQFFTGTKLLSTTTNSPYSTTWSNVPPGPHSLTAIVLNNLGLMATSSVVNITISTNLFPTADAHVRDGSFANTNFGTNILLEVQSSIGTGTNRDAYFKFDLSNVSSNISSAQLKVFAAVSNGIITNIVYSVTNTSWAETNITWSNRPSLVTPLSTNNVTGTNWYLFDVTGFVKAQMSAGQSVVSLASHDLTNYTQFIRINSRENTTNKPILIVATTNNPLVVSITNPLNNAVFVTPTNLAVNASATDTDGNVTQVQFFQGTNALGVVSNAPYNLIWSNAPAGTNLLTAVAYDDAGRTATSSIVSVTVGSPPTITGQPANQNIILSNTANFIVTATGTATLKYQWWFNATNILAGATSSSLSLTNVQTTNAGNYTVVITNSFGATTSSIAALAVLLPVTITTQPTNLVVLLTSNATFTVGTAGTTPISYQWWFNATNILTGATNASLIVTNSQQTNAGNYTVVVTNTVSSVTSSVAVLTVNAKPAITVQPTNTTVILSNTANFSVAASGTAILKFQWWFNATNIVANATNTTLALSNTQTTNVGNYTVVITNSFGAVTSSIATLTVLLPVTITAQPTNLAVLLTSNATFNVLTAGTTPIGYQWWFNATNLLGGATNASLIVTNSQQTNAGNYTVVVTNLVNTVTSSVAVLTVNAKPVISVQPTNLTVSAGGTAAFNVAASGTATLQYQWWLNATNIIAGATNTSLTVSNAQTTNAGNYTVVITNSFGAVTSSIATLTVFQQSCYSLPSGAISWWAAENNANDSIGTNNGTLQGGVTYTNGMVGQAFKFDGINGSMSSSISVLNGNAPHTIEAWVKIPSLPSSRVWMMLLGVEGAGSHHWLLNADGSTQLGVWGGSQMTPTLQTGVWTHLAMTFDGSTLACYTNGVLQSSQAASFNLLTNPVPITLAAAHNWESAFNGLIDEVTVYNRALSSNEVAGVYLVGANGKCSTTMLAITIQPTNRTVMLASNTALSVTATGATPLSYQWYTAGLGLLIGATNATLNFNNVQLLDANTYFVVVSNSYGSITSSNATLTVLAAPSIVVHPADQTVVQGSNVMMAVTASGTAPLRYQWWYNITNPIAGGTNSILTISNVQVSNIGNYLVVVTNAYGMANSSNVFLTVLAAPTITTQPANVLAAAGSNATFAVTVTGTTPLSYQWYGVNSGLLASATNYYLVLQNVQTNNADSYYVTVSNLLGAVTSSNAVLSVVVPPTVLITNPLNNAAYFTSLTNITLSASATDIAGVISQVQFFQGTNSLGIVTNPPFSMVWSNVSPGNYALTAVAVDSGLAATSPVVNIGVFATNSICVWLKANSITGLTNNATVSTWLDSSGWSNNAGSGVTGSLPIYATNVVNGLPIVRFDGLFNQLKFLNYPATNNFTIFVVARTSQSEEIDSEDNWTGNPNGMTGEHYLFGGDFDFDSSNDTAEFSLSLGTNGISVYQYHHNSSGNDQAAPQAVYNGNIGAGFNIIAIKCTNQQSSIYYNGNLVRVGLPSLRSQTTIAKTIGYGSPWGSGINADVAEIVIFNRVLADTEYPEINSYLNGKYGVAPAVPPAPTNLTATAVSSNQIVLNWTSTATNFVNGFFIERRQGAGSAYQQIATVSSALSFIDGGLFAGTTYFYRVRAYNMAGNSSYSSEVNAATLAASASIPFGNLKFWVKADGVFPQGYTNAPVGTWLDQSGNGNNAAQTTSYNQPVWVTNAIGSLPVMRFNGTNSFYNLSTFMYSETQAEAVVVLRATDISHGSHPLWQLGGWYYGYKSYPGNTNGILDDFGCGSHIQPYSFVVSNQPLDQFHIYEVVSQPGNWAAWINGVPQFQDTNNVVSFAGTPTGTKPSLGAAYPANNYPYPDPTNYFAGDIAEVMIFNRGLTSNERLTINNYLIGKYSAALALPPTPWNLAATPISPSQISLSWNEPLNGGATQISVERSTTSNGGFSVVAQLSDTHIYDTNLSTGTTYFYRVRAINQTQYATSNSAYSSIIQATTFTNGPTIPLPLAMWLRADAGVTTNASSQVSVWADQSGNGNNASQPVVTALPILTQGTGTNLVIRFDGTNSCLGLPGFMSDATAGEAFVVLKVATNFPSSGRSLWEMGGNTFFPSYYPYADGSIREDFGRSQNLSLGTTVQTLDQYHVYQVVSQSNNWAAWINGTMQFQTKDNAVNFSASPSIGISSSQAYGGGWYTTWQYFAGDVAEILVFKRGLTTTERRTINTYLNGKYNLVPAVPATPSNLVAKAISPTQIALTWDEQLNGGATQIGILRSTTSNGVYQLVAQIPGATSYIDTNLTSSTTYYYMVEAINLTQWSPTSNVAQATTFTTGANIPFASMSLWLKADAGLLQATTNLPVNRWADQSGNGNDAFAGTPPTWVSKAIGNRPVIRFNGLNTSFGLPYFMNGATGAEAFVVLKVATNQPGMNPLWEMGGDTWNAGSYPLAAGTISDDFGCIHSGDYANTGIHKFGVAQSLNQYHIYGVSSQSNNWSAWINGVLQCQDKVNTVSFSASPGLGISSYNHYITGWTTDYAYFAGDIAEILIFNRGLTAAERITINTYLNGKYALVPAVPATPSNLVATAISPTQVSLQWDATLNAGVTRISIERLSTNTWAYQEIAQVSVATSYLDTNAVPGTTYYYRVRAINIDQWSPYSGVAQAITPVTGNGLPISSLAMWVKTDAGLWLNTNSTPIAFWPDQSGNTNHLNQLDALLQPLWIPDTNGSRPAMQFNGTNSYFQLNNFLNGAGAAEAFVVLKTSVTSQFHPLWSFGGDSWDSKSYPDVDGSIKDDFGSTTVQSLGIPAQPLNQYHVYQVSSQKDNWAGWLNGQLQYQTSEAGFNLVSFAAGMSFGHATHASANNAASYYYVDDYFAGNVQEVLVFNRSLNDGERVAVNTYLNNKYGLVPAVAITNPVNNAVLMGPANIPIAAAATAPAGISQVQFFQGSASIGVVTNSPYSMTWSNVAIGSYALTAQATDGNGLVVTSVVINITVAGITITTPTNNTVLSAPANIPINATVVDGAGVSQVQFLQGTNAIVTLTNMPYSFIWSNVASGAYGLTARATDNGGLIITSAVVNVAVDTVPVVTLTNPVNNARFVAGTNINLGASATDSDGTIAQVQFFQGTNLLGTANNSPYTMIWSNVPAGAWTMTACATDNNGLVATSAVVNLMIAGIVITNPPNNIALTAPASVAIGAAVTDNTNITQVQFFQGVTSLGTMSNAPYVLNWTNIAANTYSLTAQGTDSGGLIFTSSIVNLIVDTDPNTSDRDGDGVSDSVEYLQGRNPLVNGSVADTNGVINFQIYTPMR